VRLPLAERRRPLPVQQATKVELFIDLKTAKALGLDVSVTGLGLPMRTVTAGSRRSASLSYAGCNPSGSILPFPSSVDQIQS